MDIGNEIRSRVSLADVLSYYGLKVKRNGFVHCPFHSGDNSASLKIYPNDNSWYCFGCNRGGSVIDFVMAMESVGFSEAIRRLDERYHLNLSSGKPNVKDIRRQEQERKRKEEQKIRREKQRMQLIEQRRALWKEYMALVVTEHESAQKRAELIAQVELLDAKLEKMGGDCL